MKKSLVYSGVVTPARSRTMYLHPRQEENSLEIVEPTQSQTSPDAQDVASGTESTTPMRMNVSKLRTTLKS